MICSNPSYTNKHGEERRGGKRHSCPGYVVALIRGRQSASHHMFSSGSAADVVGRRGRRALSVHGGVASRDRDPVVDWLGLRLRGFRLFRASLVEGAENHVVGTVAQRGGGSCLGCRSHAAPCRRRSRWRRGSARALHRDIICEVKRLQVALRRPRGGLPRVRRVALSRLGAGALAQHSAYEVRNG